jgi:hypothetical protein
LSSSSSFKGIKTEILALGIPYTAVSVALLIKYLIATDVLPKNFPTKPSDIVTTIATNANQNNKNPQTPA